MRAKHWLLIGLLGFLAIYPLAYFLCVENGEIRVVVPDSWAHLLREPREILEQPVAYTWPWNRGRYPFVGAESSLVAKFFFPIHVLDRRLLRSSYWTYKGRTLPAPGQ